MSDETTAARRAGDEPDWRPFGADPADEPGPGPRPGPTETIRDGVRGVSVLLADGRAWTLAAAGPLVKPRFTPDPESPGGVRTEPVHGYGYPMAIRRMIAAVGESPGQFGPLLALASALLMRAHAIEPDHAADLLTLDHEELAELLRILITLLDDSREV